MNSEFQAPNSGFGYRESVDKIKTAGLRKPAVFFAYY
jgi:hypothetical protein